MFASGVRFHFQIPPPCSVKAVGFGHRVEAGKAEEFYKAPNSGNKLQNLIQGSANELEYEEIKRDVQHSKIQPFYALLNIGKQKVNRLLQENSRNIPRKINAVLVKSGKKVTVYLSGGKQLKEDRKREAEEKEKKKKEQKEKEEKEKPKKEEETEQKEKLQDKKEKEKAAKSLEMQGRK